MSQRILTVNVDLSHPLVVHPIPGIMGGGDRYADIIRVLVYQNGEPVTLSGTVTGYVMNRAGDTFAIDGVCSGNGVQVQLIEEVYELPGPITIAVRLVNGDVKTTLAICSTAVKMTATTTVYDPGDIVPDIDDVRARLAEVIAATEAANAAAANANVLHDQLLIEQQIGLPGTPMLAYFDLGNSKTEGTSVISTMTNGQRAHYVLVVSGLVAGEVFKVTAKDGATARPWAVLDSGNVLQLRADSTGTATNDTVTVPSNCNGGTLIVQVAEDQISGASVVRMRNLAQLQISQNSSDNAIWASLGRVSITAQAAHFWNCENSVVYLDDYSTYSAFSPVTVNPGEYYKVTVFQATSSKQHPAVFVDADWNLIKYHSGTNSIVNTFSGIVPPGAAYLLLTTFSIYAGSTQVWLPRNMGEIAQNYCKTAGMMDFSGKRVAIIGDSISTNGDLTSSNPYGNVPEILIGDDDVGVQLSAYPTYYDIGVTVGGHEIVSADVGTELTFTPVAADVGKMVGKPLSYNAASTIVWWEVMMDALGFTPIPVCWSGSSITSHEDSDSSLKTSYAWHDAQIRKCGVRTPGSMTRTAPDVVIIYRGTNDFSHTSYAKLTDGYFDSASWAYPDTDAVDGGYGYKEGLCLTVKKIRAAYPNAKIFLCTLNVFKRVSYAAFPTKNGTSTLPQYNAAIREVADYLGCGLIEFDKDGISFENCYSEGYITDNATHPTHPSNKGHKVMGNRALLDFVRQCNSMT